MMVRLPCAAFAAAVILFLWGFFWWTILAMSSGYYASVSPEDQAAITASLRERLTRTDVYFIPFPDPALHEDEAAQAEFLRRHTEGPLIQVFYRQQGANPMSPWIMAAGFAHMFAASLVAGGLLVAAHRSLCCFWGRVAFVTAVGAFSGFWQGLGDMIWFFHPAHHVLFDWAFDVTGWFLAGLALAAIIKPRPERQVWRAADPG